MADTRSQENAEELHVVDAASLLQACDLSAQHLPALPSEYTFAYTPPTPPIANLRTYVSVVAPELLQMQFLPPKSDAGMMSRVAALLRIPLHLYGGSVVMGDARDLVIVEERHIEENGVCGNEREDENEKDELERGGKDSEQEDKEKDNNQEAHDIDDQEVEEGEKSGDATEESDNESGKVSGPHTVPMYSLQHHPTHSPSQQQQLIILAPSASTVRCIVRITPYLPPNITSHPPHYQLMSQLILAYQKITSSTGQAPTLFGILTNSSDYIFYKLSPATASSSVPPFSITMSKSTAFAEMADIQSAQTIVTSPSHLIAYSYLIDVFPSSDLTIKLSELRDSIASATNIYLKQIFLEHDYTDRMAELARQQEEMESVNSELERQKKEIERKRVELERLRNLENSLKE